MAGGELCRLWFLRCCFDEEYSFCVQLPGNLNRRHPGGEERSIPSLLTLDRKNALSAFAGGI